MTLVYGTDVIAAVDGKIRGEVAIVGADHWVEAGIPAPAILKAMITEAHRLLGLDAEPGSIKASQAADLIATADDPLANIAALKKVQFLMKDGYIGRQASLAAATPLASFTVTRSRPPTMKKRITLAMPTRCE